MTPVIHEHLDARRLVVPLWASVLVAMAMVGSAATVVGLYINMTNKIDTLLASIDRVSQAAESALTPRDLELFCFRAQAVNTNWRCPGFEPPVQQRPRPAPRRPQEAKAN